MKSTVFYLAITSLLSCGGPSSPKNTTKDAHWLPASSLHPVGRYDWNEKQHLELITSAAHFGFSFSGTECKVFAYLNDVQAHNYLQYELDGVYQKRIRISGTETQQILINASTTGQHTVRVYKATEAHTGPIFIDKIEGENIQPLKPSEQSLIEFIGNSITCGAAADGSEIPCGTGVYHDQHNAYYAYGPRVSRALNVDFLVSGVSGYGIYRTWSTERPNLPQVYEKMDFQLSGHRLWNFATYAPRIVSIALGTNDYSNGDGIHERLPFDSALFVGNYIKFVELVKSKYPAARIALLSSPMLNGERRASLQNCLSAVKQKIDSSHPSDQKVALYFFKPMQPRGCGGHPSVEDHAILADELTPFFKSLL